MITLKSIPVWATSGGPTHDEPMAAPWEDWDSVYDSHSSAVGNWDVDSGFASSVFPTVEP